MKLNKILSTVLVATTLLVATPVFAGVQENVALTKIEQTIYRETILKNPIYIDGVAYADGDFLREALNLRHISEGIIIRDDKIIYMTPSNNTNKTYPRVNGAYSGDYTIKYRTHNGKLVYPIRFLANQFGAELKYDSKTGSITIIDKGLLQIERTSEKFNTVRGRVIDQEGKPAVGVKVLMYGSGGINRPSKFESVTNPTSSPNHPMPVAITDENGYYEFYNVDTELEPFVTVSIQNETYKGMDISGNSAGKDVDREFLTTVTQDTKVDYSLPSLMKGLYSDRVEMPTIYLYER